MSLPGICQEKCYAEDAEYIIKHFFGEYVHDGKEFLNNRPVYKNDYNKFLYFYQYKDPDSGENQGNWMVQYSKLCLYCATFFIQNIKFY